MVGAKRGLSIKMRVGASAWCGLEHFLCRWYRYQVKNICDDSIPLVNIKNTYGSAEPFITSHKEEEVNGRCEWFYIHFLKWNFMRKRVTHKRESDVLLNSNLQ